MMMVRGTLDGVAYLVATRTPTDGPDALGQLRDRMPGAQPWGGLVFGTPRILEVLARAEGQRCPLTPTGPDVTLEAGDASSIAAWLRANTDVDDVAGEPARWAAVDGLERPADESRVY